MNPAGNFGLRPNATQEQHIPRKKNYCEEYILDQGGVIVSSNLNIPRVTGYSQPEVIGKHISILYTPEDVKSKRIDLELAAVDQKGMYAYTGYKLKKEGIRFWSKTRINKLKDSFGGSAGYKISLRDLTYYPSISAHIKRLENEHFEVLNDSSVGIFKFSLENYKIIQCNEKVLNFLDNKPGASLNLSDLFSNSLEYASLLRLVETKDQIKAFEFALKGHGRSEVWFSLDCKIFHSEGYAEGVLFDISSFRILMNQYQELKEDLNSFIYHTSHDLRSPLTSISGLINLIKMDKESLAFLPYLEMIQGRVNHLDELLKDFSAISYNNNYDPTYTSIELKSDIQRIIQNFSHYSMKISILIEINEECPFISDSFRINTILRNLISNAFKFYNSDITDPFVKIEATVTPMLTTLKVSDNGIGIDNNYLVSIFNMFTRMTHESRDGNGLGLYIVKSMVDKLRGTIDVKSQLGYGCEFTLQLPNISGPL